MKRRWWWFIGLALALLAACVGVWQWSERPPFAFLAQSRLVFMDRNSAENGVRQWRKIYASTEDPDRIFQQAVYEMPDALYDAEGTAWLLSDDGQFYVSIDPIRAYHGEADLYPKGTVSVIHLDYADSSTLDRFRVWLYGLGRPKFHP